MSMILPQANLKAKDLLRDLLPDKRLLKAYKDVGKEDDYERSCHERAYVQFHTLITSNHPQVLNQEVEQKISNLMRVKDSKGEWLVYGVLLVAKDWKGNKHDFFHTEGKISNGSVDGLPVFNNEVDPNTNEIIPGTTQLSEHKQVYTIPFTKEKVKELSHFFTEPHSFMIQESNGRTYTCTEKEFIEMSYQELIDLKSGYLDYKRTKQGGVTLKIGIIV